MNSFKKLWLFVTVKIAAVVFMFLPIGMGLWIGRCLGTIGYCFLSKKRAVVYANLKTVFAAERSPSQIRALTRDVFINFAQSFVELLCLPRIKRLGFERFVDVLDKENIDHALERGRGVIFLALHSGSWELASVVGGVTKRSYHVVANDQPKMPQLDKMLNEYRTSAGAHVILAGQATKEMITAMNNNEIISLVLDQGGKEGVVVPFLGKTASLSTGAIRLALKYGSAVCPVWIERKRGGKHALRVYPAMPLISTGDFEKDTVANVVQAAGYFEPLLRQHPQEYLWFYKVFKYSTQARVVIIDDGRTGHLRQSQSLSSDLGGDVKEKREICHREYHLFAMARGVGHFQCFSFYAFLSQYLAFLRRESCLKYFLTKSCYEDLMKLKADFIVSCGSQAAGVNFILSQNHLAKSISILTPGLLSPDRFNVVAQPEYERPRICRRHV